MAQVLGIGGVFVMAQDPKALAAWYRRVLGFDIQSWGGATWPHGNRGVTLWSPFQAGSDYFAPSKAPMMFNLIVDDLDGMLARAQAEGVEPTGRSDEEGMGRFAWVMDPEGFKIELWEPPADGS